MTRTQALQEVKKLLENQEQTYEVVEIIHKLDEIIADMPLNHWTEKAIFDSFTQFAIDNDRNATTSDMKFRSSGLPPHPVIKLRFGIEAKEFIDKYFSTEFKCNSKIFKHKTKEEWLNIFIKEYETIKPSSAEKYNEHRRKGLPSWQSTAKLYNIQLWSVFREFSKVEVYTKGKKIKKREPMSFIIKSHTDYESTFRKIK